MREIWAQASALTLEYGQILIFLSLRFHCKRGIVIVLVAARRQAGRPVTCLAPRLTRKATLSVAVCARTRVLGQQTCVEPSTGLR